MTIDFTMKSAKNILEHSGETNSHIQGVLLDDINCST